ncbi:Constitutive lysine decarboxylase [compost metagenome]
MLVPYPPGIPLIMPGERFTQATRSIIDYLEFARTFDRRFPGFDADVHGLQHEEISGERCYTVDCIKT